MKPTSQYHINNVIRAYDAFMEDPHTLNTLLKSIEDMKAFRERERMRDDSQLTLKL